MTTGLPSIWNITQGNLLTRGHPGHSAIWVAGSIEIAQHESEIRFWRASDHMEGPEQDQDRHEGFGGHDDGR
jgi:hypothetical protein